MKIQPDLYRVVTLLIINGVTQDLYLSDRSRPRLIIFDEAWQFLGKGAMIAPVINEGYRRARKNKGSFMVITQFLLDLESFGEVGKVINSNSAGVVVIDGTDPKQISWYQKTPYMDNRQVRLLLSDVYAFELSRLLKRPVFYLTKDIASRLQLASVPAVVVQHDRSLLAHEITVPHERQENQGESTQ